MRHITAPPPPPSTAPAPTAPRTSVLDSVLENGERRWLVEGRDCTDDLGRLGNSFVAAAEAVADKIIIPRPERGFRKNHTRYIAGSNGKLVFYTCNSASPMRWDAIHMFGEIKKSPDTDAQWKVDCRLAGYAREVFHSEARFYLLVREHGVHGLVVAISPLCVRNNIRCFVHGPHIDPTMAPTKKRKAIDTGLPDGSNAAKRMRFTGSESCTTLNRDHHQHPPPTVTSGTDARAVGSDGTSDKDPETGEDRERCAEMLVGTNDLPDRVALRLVYNDVGQPLSHLTSPRHLFEVLLAVLEDHRRLYEDAGILNYEISMDNIMATTAENGLTRGRYRHHDHESGLINQHQPAGFLSDFIYDSDYVMHMTERLLGTKHRTGTPLFASVARLRNKAHSYRSDLESFFYVMCYVCTRYPEEEERTLTDELRRNYKSWHYQDKFGGAPLTFWATYPERMVGYIKAGTLMCCDQLRRHVLDRLTPTYSVVAPLLEALRVHLNKLLGYHTADRAEVLQDARRDGDEAKIATLLSYGWEDDEETEANNLYHAMVARIKEAIASWD